MGALIKGEVVVVPFPFSDLSKLKRRPALVLASAVVLANLAEARARGEDVMLCAISHSSDKSCIQINSSDLETGELRPSGDPQPSYVRPTAIFTLEARLILYSIGHLKSDKMNEIVERLIKILSQ